MIGKLVEVKDDAEVEHTGVEDELEHLAGFLIARAFSFQNDVVQFGINARAGDVGQILHHDAYDVSLFRVDDGGCGDGEQGTVMRRDFGIVLLLGFFIHRDGKNAVRCDHAAQSADALDGSETEENVIGRERILHIRGVVVGSAQVSRVEAQIVQYGVDHVQGAFAVERVAQILIGVGYAEAFAGSVEDEMHRVVSAFGSEDIIGGISVAGCVLVYGFHRIDEFLQGPLIIVDFVVEIILGEVVLAGQFLVVVDGSGGALVQQEQVGGCHDGLSAEGEGVD